MMPAAAFAARRVVAAQRSAARARRADRAAHGDRRARRHRVGARAHSLRARRRRRDARRRCSIKWYLGGIAGDELQIAERMQQRPARRHRLGRHVVQAAVAVDARVAHGRPVPDARRVDLRARAPASRNLDEEFAQSGLRQPRRGRHRARPLLLAQAGAHHGRSASKARLWIVEPRRRAARRSCRRWACTPCRCRSTRPVRAYDDERIDGFIAVPSAALAFQWSAQARYVTDLRVALPARLRAHVDARLRSARRIERATRCSLERGARHDARSRSSGGSRTSSCSAGCSPSRG